jgi:hypothetical protein
MNSLPPPAVPRVPSPARHHVVSFALGACVVYYLWIVTSAASDIQGDSWEYINIASWMRDGVFDTSSYNYLRGVVYPWLLWITWGQSGILTYFIQVAVFLASLCLALHFIVSWRISGLLPILAAMLPAVAFLQKQLYPDGLLISLVLLFCVFLTRKYWLACVLVGLILALTKLIFIVVLPVTLIVFLLHRRPMARATLARAAIALLVVAPIAVLLFYYVFVDVAYMVVFARPYAHGYGVERAFPFSELRVRCGGREYRVGRAEFFLDPITLPHQLAIYGPLTQEHAARLGCTPIQLRAMKREILAAGFASDPVLHFGLAARYFGRATVGSYYFGHVSYMLDLRKRSWLGHYDQRSYFEPNEIRLIGEYKKLGFDVGARSGPAILAYNDLVRRIGEGLLRLLSVAALILGMAIAYRRKHLRDLLLDPGNLGMLLFLILYSLALCISAVLTIYDRYTLVNLLVLCLLAARVGAMTFGREAKTESPS